MRQKKNKSGIVSIQVIDKSSGTYKVAQTIGSSADKVVIERMVLEGKHWIIQQTKVQEFDFADYKQQTKQVLDGVEELILVGGELLLGKIFEDIGLGKIPDELFRKLVLSRLLYPVSKLKTTDWLNKYQYLNIDVERIYRYLDKLHSSQKKIVQQISYDHTLKILNGNIQIIFYDVTTVYFEAESEDELRKTGFSKEGKHRNPQIVLGLLVSTGGYPLAYEIFEGNKFEGHTMLPVIEHFKNQYKVEHLVVVADAGLHRLPRRIEAHICISFVAYKVYKELERLLKQKHSDLSPEKAIDIAKTIFAIRVVHPISKDIILKTLILKEEQRTLANLFCF